MVMSKCISTQEADTNLSDYLQWAEFLSVCSDFHDIGRWKPIDFLSFIFFFLAFKEKELMRQQAELLKQQVGSQHNLLIPPERDSYCWIKPFNSDVSKNLQACMCVWLSDYICVSAYIWIQVCVCLCINVVSISLYLTQCLLVLDLLLQYFKQAFCCFCCVSFSFEAPPPIPAASLFEPVITSTLYRISVSLVWFSLYYCTLHFCFHHTCESVYMWSIVLCLFKYSAAIGLSASQLYINTY